MIFAVSVLRIKNASADLIGWISILIWCVFSAVARVYTGHITQTVPPLLLSFYIFLISAFVFFVLNSRGQKKFWHKFFNVAYRKDIFCLNITTFAAWFFLIPSLKYIQPAIVSAMTLGTGPIATMILTNRSPESRGSFANKFIALCIFLLVLYNVFLCMTGILTVGYPSILKRLYAVLCALIVGFGTAAGNIYSKKLSKHQFLPLEVLASRFFLTVTVTGLILLMSHSSFVVPRSEYFDMILLAFSLVVIPLYLVQVSIKMLDPICIATVAPLMPILVLIIQRFFMRTPLPFLAEMAVLPMSVFIFGGVYLNFKGNKLIKNNKHEYSSR